MEKKTKLFIVIGGILLLALGVIAGITFSNSGKKNDDKKLSDYNIDHHSVLYLKKKEINFVVKIEILGKESSPSEPSRMPSTPAVTLDL